MFRAQNEYVTALDEHVFALDEHVVRATEYGAMVSPHNDRRHRAGREECSISNAAANPAPCARHGYAPSGQRKSFQT